MLTDDIDALTERIKRLGELQNIASEAERFETRATQIEQLADDLRSPTNAVEVLRNNDVEISFPAPPPGLIRFAENLKQLLENDPASALSDKSGFGQKFKSPLGSFCERASAAATAAWSEHVRKNTPKVDQGILSAYAKLKGFADSVSRVRSYVTQIEGYQTRTPTCDDDIRRFDEALQALKNALVSLGSDELPEEIRDFMRRVGLDGFPLDELTDEILDWLREHDLLGQFVVKTA